MSWADSERAKRWLFLKFVFLYALHTNDTQEKLDACVYYFYAQTCDVSKLFKHPWLYFSSSQPSVSSLTWRLVRWMLLLISLFCLNSRPIPKIFCQIILYVELQRHFSGTSSIKKKINCMHLVRHSSINRYSSLVTLQPQKHYPNIESVVYVVWEL